MFIYLFILLYNIVLVLPYIHMQDKRVFKKKIIYFWLCWVLVAARLFSSCGGEASHCGVFSCCRAQALGCMAFSGFSSWALEHRLSSCGT